MIKLLRYLKPYTKECILSPSFKLLEAALELIVPLLVANIIDKGISDGDTAYIVKMVTLMIFFGIVGFSFTLVAQYFAAKAAVGFSCKIRHELFSHIQKLSYNEIDKIGTATIITRMTSDINQVQNGVNMTLRLFLRAPIIVFGAMIMAFTVDVKSALVFVGTVPLLSLVVFGIMALSIPLYKKVQGLLDLVLMKTRENLSGVRVIRAFCNEETEVKSFQTKNEALTKAQKFVGKISALMNPLTFVIINLAVVVLIYVGAIRVDGGIITKGMVVALYNYMSQILIELIKLANLIVNVTKSVACGSRIEELLETEPSMTNGDKKVGLDTDISVEFKNVSFKYETSPENALSNISFTAKKGESIGIIGGTGSGKTSLINLIPRFYDATSGEVFVCGINVREYSFEALREKIGVVPQKSVLFKGSIRDNLKWGREGATGDEIISALKLSQAYEIVEAKDGGLDYIIEQDGKNLSGGQRQRLAIARALVKNPEILILDDSSSALDYATDSRLRYALEGLKNVTKFIVSQRTSSVMGCDKIIVLDDGDFVGCGTHSELINTCDVYKEIYDSQFKGGADDER